MAIIYPDSRHREYDDKNQNGESAEEKVCRFIEASNLDDMHIGIFNQYFDTRKPDIVMVIPKHGILIIEVKAYSRSYLKEYNDNFKLVTTNGEEFDHPYDQVKKIGYSVSGKIKLDCAEYIAKNQMCKVASIIAMPNLSIDEYCQIGLDMACSPPMVIAKDDFIDQDHFNNKFAESIEAAFTRVNGAAFDLDYYNQICCELIPSRRSIVHEQIDESVNKKISPKGDENSSSEELKLPEVTATTDQIDQIFKSIRDAEQVNSYSILRIINNQRDLESQIAKLLEERRNGTSIYIIYIGVNDSEKKSVLSLCHRMLSNQLTWNCNSITEFLFSLHFITGVQLEGYCHNEEYLDDDFIELYSEIVDGGKVIEAFEKGHHGDHLEDCLLNILECANTNTFFNMNQYIIEHFTPGKSLSVVASAGTGKTFTMIGRISFLIHKEIFEQNFSRKVEDVIYMMTFTNNSTDEMRNKLYKHYINYFRLTQKKMYMNIVEQIGNMSIRTINATAKQMLQRYSYLLGLSPEFTIRSGAFNKKNIIRRCIEKELEQSEIKDKILNNFRIYELVNVVWKMNNFLYNRSIMFDSQNGLYNKFEEEKLGNKDVKDFIERVIRQANYEYIMLNHDNNQVAMSEIILQLDYIKTILAKENKGTITQNAENKYLFIDEFQDTDNKQIELISFFTKYYDLKLFVVGDKKQCIYGFRGANDSSFLTLEKLNGKSVELSLQKNYRTDRILMNKFNKLFKTWSGDQFKFDKRDELIPQKYFHTDTTKEEDVYFGISYADTQELESSLKKLIDQNVPLLKDGEKIAILVRKNSEVDQIREISINFDHMVEFDNGGQFYSTDAVIDFYKLLLFLVDCNDSVKKYNLSITPYSEKTVSRSYFLNEQTELSFDSITGFEFNGYIEKLKYNPAMKVLKTLVYENKPWERYVPEHNEDLKNELSSEDIKCAREEYKEHLEQLFQLLIDNNMSDYVTINKIINFLRINIITRQDQECNNELSTNEQYKVICTTVHKAKGLQYDTVILPFCVSDISKPRSQTNMIETLKDGQSIIDYSIKENNFMMESVNYKQKYDDFCGSLMSEELRILYVALTRAKRKLIYLYNEGECKGSQYYWYDYLK